MVTVAQLEQMDRNAALALVYREILARNDRGGLQGLYPDDGPLRRELYAKHLRMFAAGATHSERIALGGNRVGKSFGIGGYETALHLTGLYPHWWEGHRFTKPILAWACGTKGSKVRDTNQHILMGKLRRTSSVTTTEGGFIPPRSIDRVTRRTGVSDAVDTAIIRHRGGWENKVVFKGYEEGRHAFEAEAVDWCWLDEEPTQEIYDECVLRLLTTNGRLILTLTPVDGMTECVKHLLEGTHLL